MPWASAGTIFPAKGPSFPYRDAVCFAEKEIEFFPLAGLLERRHYRSRAVVLFMKVNMLVLGDFKQEGVLLDFDLVGLVLVLLEFDAVVLVLGHFKYSPVLLVQPRRFCAPAIGLACWAQFGTACLGNFKPAGVVILVSAIGHGGGHGVSVIGLQPSHACITPCCRPCL